jgi:hypothetical protein
MQSVLNCYTARRKTKREKKEMAILAALADEGWGLIPAIPTTEKVYLADVCNWFTYIFSLLSLPLYNVQYIVRNTHLAMIFAPCFFAHNAPL